MRARHIGAVAAAAVVVLAVAGCSSKAAGSTAKVGADGVMGGPGVTDSEITLGLLTDKTGPFKNNGLVLTHGNELWAADVNARGGVCGRQIKLDTVDSGYKADTAKSVYPQVEPKIAGFLQVIGSPIMAALKQNMADDKLTSLAVSWSSQILDNPYVMIPGATYDVEMINGLSYLQSKGLLKAGDTVGHVYVDGEFGSNGLRGSQYYASKHGLKLAPVKVTSADTDMTNIVTGLRGQGVKAILLTTTPAQAMSVAGASQALGLNVPLLGNNPTFEVGLLNSPAASALSRMNVVTSSVPFSSSVPKAREVAEKYRAKFAEPPSSSVPYGYANGEIWEQILTRACVNKDLSRDGIHRALEQSTSITTDDVVADLDFSEPGSPATRQTYITQVDPTVPGGLREVSRLVAAPDALTYKAPHEK